MGNEEMFSNWLMPIWTGGTVWEEPVCFFEDGQGVIQGGSLVYAPNEVVKVMNHDATIIFEENRDYEVTKAGIRLMEGSRIPLLKRESYIGQFTGDTDVEWLCLPGKKQYVRIFSEITQYQVLVTYETAEGTWRGPVPSRQGGKLVNTYRKLERGEPLHIVFYGDSITAGWEASGADEKAVDMYSLEPMEIKFSRYPHMPVWAELVTEKIRRTYPQAVITKDNLSAGGSTAQWGLEHVNELFDRVATPDLVLVGFGMNCMWDPPEVFINYISGICGELRKRNSNCEFVLYPAMVANPEMSAYQNDNMCSYEKALENYASNQSGMVAAPIHSMFRKMVEQGKQYYEISGNAVNHPNDFSIRLYAQIIWETLCR